MSYANRSLALGETVVALYYGGESGFEPVLDLVVHASDDLVAKLRHRLDSYYLSTS